MKLQIVQRSILSVLLLGFLLWPEPCEALSPKRRQRRYVDLWAHLFPRAQICELCHKAILMSQWEEHRRMHISEDQDAVDRREAMLRERVQKQRVSDIDTVSGLHELAESLLDDWKEMGHEFAGNQYLGLIDEAGTNLLRRASSLSRKVRSTLTQAETAVHTETTKTYRNQCIQELEDAVLSFDATMSDVDSYFEVLKTRTLVTPGHKPESDK